MPKKAALGWWLLLIPLAFVRFGGLARLFPSMRVRMDPSGDGHFGAVRDGHVHEGLDVLATPGTWIASPVTGTYVGTGKVYRGDARFDIVALEGEGYRVDLMYVRPFDFLEPGVVVQRGQSVGVVQDIVAKYGAPMLAHVHVEIRKAGELMDPERLLPMDPLA